MDYSQFKEQGNNLIAFYNAVRASYVPDTAKQALDEAWQLQITGLQTKALTTYSAEDMKQDRQRVIRADVAIKLMLELEQELVEALIVDEFTILGRKIWGLWNSVKQLGAILLNHSKLLLIALIALVSESAAKFGTTLFAFWTQDAEKLAQAEDATIKTADVIAGIVDAAVKEIVHVSFKRVLEAFSVALYLKTVNQGLLVGKVAQGKARKAALPQRDAKRYRRRKATNR